MSDSSEEFKKIWEEQPMLRPRIESVKINVSLGVAGKPLERARKIILDLTGQQPKDTIAKNTWRSWGIRKAQPVGVTVTLRGNPAYELLMRLLHAKEYRLKSRSIDKTGNFAFGINEHIDIPDMSYDPNLGIIGMNVVVQMGRAGYRVKQRKYKNHKLGGKHTLTRDDTSIFLVDNYGIELI